MRVLPSEVAEDLAALSPAFFDEVEELKFKYIEATRENERLRDALFRATGYVGAHRVCACVRVFCVCICV